MLFLKKPLIQAFFLVLLSWLVATAGILLGEAFVDPGDGYPRPQDVQADLFRFDSAYYQSIAENSYQYSGDPFSSPNIVFAPLYPLLVRLLSQLPGLDTVTAGFAVNALLLLLSVYFLILFLKKEFTQTAALLTLFAMLSASGSYAFHAYYSESTMLFCLSLGLLSWQRQWLFVTGFAVGLLGASRLAALPMICGWLLLIWWSFPKKPIWQKALASGLSLSGSAAYLGYLAWHFGEPFALLDSIQKSSWGRFHNPADWKMLFTGGYFIDYLFDAVEKGLPSLTDIQTLNLIWLTLAGAACVHLMIRRRESPLAALFIPYFLFVYHSNITSPYLISCHRLFVIMLPIFLMFVDLIECMQKKGWRWPARFTTVALLTVNLAYGLLHTAMFNQGVWFWF